jgi:hypothetical protein
LTKKKKNGILIILYIIIISNRIINYHKDDDDDGDDIKEYIASRVLTLGLRDCKLLIITIIFIVDIGI